MIAWLLVGSDAEAALVTNAAIPITHRVTVQPIIVSNSDGSNTATYMGTQTAEIQNGVDAIWSQAGIDVAWLTPNHWNSSFTNIGNPPYPLFDDEPTRPQSDLASIANNGQAAGVGSATPNVLSMYFVRVSPGHAVLSANSVAGLAQIDGADSTLFIGENLPGLMLGIDPIGNDLIAQILAHEMGHNFGLDHPDPLLGESGPENLMLAVGNLQPINARLNSQQIQIARASHFAVAIPEPTSILLWGMLSGAIAVRRCFLRRPSSC